MSLLRSLFGKRSIEELTSEADALFARGELGEAKLAYDRLAERARGDSAVRERAEARASECCDGIAHKRIEEARLLARNGHDDLAREELRHALETARSPAAQQAVQACMRELERTESETEAAEPSAALSDEEQLLLVTSGWEASQAEELEGYGEPLLQALLALDRGHGERALALLSPLAARAPKPRWLWLELGRAHLLRQALDDAERALRTFLRELAGEPGAAARLLAHRELARLAHERGDRDAAVAELEACAEALSEDPRPYLDLGNYLRLIGRPREAIEVLELCAGLFPEGAVEWPVRLELGLACAAADEGSRATRLLEGVLETLLAQDPTNLPPAAAVPLAVLHERAGNLTRAADLYRALAQGGDVDNHPLYYGEAARLLDVLQLTDEAARMRERAAALGAS